MLLLFYNHSFRNRSRRNRIRTMTEPHSLLVRDNIKPNEPLLPKYEHVLPKNEKVRTQYLRLGSVDHPNKKI